MERQDIIKTISMKVLESKWHFLKYHFIHSLNGAEHFLCTSIFDACQRIEAVMPGYTKTFSDKLSTLSGREMYLPHYEQIIQLLAELYTINHIVSIGLPDASYIHEPKAIGSKKNPEIGIILPDLQIYVEVKCREYIKHHNDRSAASIELPARMDGMREFAKKLLDGAEGISYPRDNVVKDFLISANDKFQSFKQRPGNVVTILVIVWDDFIYEPITALLNPHSGLLTENSFFCIDGRPAKFDNIDGVILARHSHQIVRATRDEPLFDGLRHPLDWGDAGTVLPKAYVPISAPEEVGFFIRQMMQAHHINELQDAADYRPQEFVMRPNNLPGEDY